MGKEVSKFEVRFNDLTVAEATVRAAELRNAVLDASSEVSANIVKDDQATMDMGATLVLLLGAPAAVAVAKGVADYMRRAGVSVTIVADGKETTFKNMAGSDIANSLKAIFSKK